MLSDDRRRNEVTEECGIETAPFTLSCIPHCDVLYTLKAHLSIPTRGFSFLSLSILHPLIVLILYSVARSIRHHFMVRETRDYRRGILPPCSWGEARFTTSCTTRKEVQQNLGPNTTEVEFTKGLCAFAKNCYSQPN